MSAHWGGASSSPYPPHRTRNGEDQYYYYAPPSSDASRFGYHDSRPPPPPPPPPSSVAPYYHGDRTPGGAGPTAMAERRRFDVHDPYASAPYDHRSSSAYHDRPPRETFPGYRNESYVRLDDGRPPPPPYGLATTTTTTTTAPSPRYDDYRDGHHRSSGPPPAWAAPFLARCDDDACRDGDACGEQCSLFDNRVSNDATMRPTTFYCATNAFGGPNGAAGAGCVPIPSRGSGFESGGGGDPSVSWRGR